MRSNKKCGKTENIHFKASSSQFDYFFSFKVIKGHTVGLQNSGILYIAVNVDFGWTVVYKMNMFLKSFRAALGTKMRTKVVLDVGESLSARMHSKNRYHSPNTLRQGCNRPSEDSASQTWVVTSPGEFYFPVTLSILK